MTIRHMSTRVDALEAASPLGKAECWHWIIGEVGETHDQARARYERQNGPIGSDEDAVIWEVVECA